MKTMWSWHHRHSSQRPVAFYVPIDDVFIIKFFFFLNWGYLGLRIITSYSLPYLRQLGVIKFPDDGDMIDD